MAAAPSYELAIQGLFLRPSAGGGKLVAGVGEPYRYLPRSVKQFLGPSALAEVMVRAGLHDVVWRTMTLGTVAIHVGTK